MSHTAYICISHTDTCGNIPIDILTRAIDRCSREVSLFPESGREPSRRKMNNLTIRTHTHTLSIYTATGMRNYYFIYFENVRVGWGESKLRCEGARVRVSLRLRVRVTLGISLLSLRAVSDCYAITEILVHSCSSIPKC